MAAGWRPGHAGSAGMSDRPIDPPELLSQLVQRPRRVLVCGAPGSDRVPAAAALAAALSAAGADYPWLDADLSQPLFAVPGTAASGRHRASGWQIEGWEPLCTLDGSRFRLPLLLALQRLLRAVEGPGLLLHGPGLARGIAGAELLEGLVDAAGIDTVLWLASEGAAVPGWPEWRNPRLRWGPGGTRAGGSTCNTRWHCVCHCPGSRWPAPRRRWMPRRPGAVGRWRCPAVAG